MFLLVLGGSLVLGAGLLAAASLSDGTLVASTTAARSIGWLFVLATIVGLTGLRHASFGRLGASMVTFLSGLAVLYVSYFEWGPVLDAPIRHAAAAQVLSVHEPVYKVIDPGAPTATVALTSVQGPTREVPTERKPVLRKIVAATSAPQPPRDACASETGVAWIVCRERARLDYCQGREDDEAMCPSAIPYSPPG